MTVAVGIDVGATKLAAALVDLDRGAVLERALAATQPHRGPTVVLDHCRALADEVARAASGPVAAVGVGVCELVSPGGEVRSAATLDWRETDVAAAFAHLAPARVDADVRAAALAEARHGAGRDRPDFLYVSVGSGISHCLVADGRPRAGAHGSALLTGAPLVERWSSGLGLARRTGHRRAEDVLADPGAQPAVEDGAKRLGEVLACLVNAVDPGAVVFGGGLGLNARYRDRVVAKLREGVYDDEVRRLPVLPAALGPDAGVVGAALVGAETAYAAACAAQSR